MPLLVVARAQPEGVEVETKFGRTRRVPATDRILEWTNLAEGRRLHDLRQEVPSTAPIEGPVRCMAGASSTSSALVPCKNTIIERAPSQA